MEEKEIIPITLGLLKEENIHSTEDFEKYLDRRGIVEPEVRKRNITSYQAFKDSLSILGSQLSIYQNLSIFIQPLKDIFSSLSPLLPTIRTIAQVIEPFKYFVDSLRPLKDLIKFSEWYKKVEENYKKIKDKYLLYLIKSYTTFKQQFNFYKKNRYKRIIVFSQYYLFLSSIFENFTKQFLLLIKNEPMSKSDRIYRKELRKEMKKFCKVGKINFYKFYHFLYNIVDLIKHEDSIFYNRYNNLTPRELLKEANELYLSLKYYIKNALSYSFFFKIKLNFSN